MADNTVIPAGSGGDTIATDDIGGTKVQRVKVQFGADGSATDASSAAPFPVYVVSALPAGTNNIGDVDVLTLPALPTGTNSIGGVTQGAGPSTATQAGTSVTVGTSSTTLVSANASRKLLVISNDHATNILYVRLGASAAVANQGIRLNAAGGSLTLRGDEYTGEVRAIASGASTVVTLSEV